MNPASVAVADRFVRQSGYGQENGVERRAQLKGIRVDCSGATVYNVIAVEIEFLEPFNGVIYSKGRHDDPKCRLVHDIMYVQKSPSCQTSLWSLIGNNVVMAISWF